MRVMERASAVQKAQFALRLLIDKAGGRYPGGQVWLDRLEVSAYELVVRLGNEAEDGAGNRSQPVALATNQTSAAAGSGPQPIR